MHLMNALGEHRVMLMDWGTCTMAPKQTMYYAWTACEIYTMINTGEGILY